MFAPRKIPAPTLNPESTPFWEAAARGQLLVGHCQACTKPHYYPRKLCPHCGSDLVLWQPALGTGAIYSFTPLRRAPEPYVLAYVMLTEGVAMLTNIVECDPDRIQIGQAVVLTFVAAEDGQSVPMFKPAHS